jgi:hypothetical protein
MKIDRVLIGGLEYNRGRYLKFDRQPQVATLHPETSASLNLLRDRCLAIIDLATRTESKLFVTFGETTETLVGLSELNTVNRFSQGQW